MNKQVEQIKSEIEKHLLALHKVAHLAATEQEKAWGRGNEKALNEILSFINSLPEEGWISVKDALPPIDEEVIVLSSWIGGKIVEGINYISFGHIVDRRYATDYNGWNIPGVHHWFPCPKIKGEE